MERETNILHLLGDHPIALFLIGAVLLVSSLLLIVAKVHNRSKRRSDRDVEE